MSLNPNSPETKVPALPTPQSPQQLLQAIKELVEVREGVRGNPLDQNVTWRELVKSGVANIVINGQQIGGGDPSFPLQPGVGTTDLTPPPQPVGLSASGAFQNVILGWNDPGNPNISMTEVWRSATNVAPDVAGTAAVRVGTTEAYAYADVVGVAGATRYYWVRFVSKADVAGPFSAVTSGATGKIGNVDLNPLIIEAANLADDSVVAGKLAANSIAVGSAAIQNGAISNAMIADLAVDSAKIADAAIVEAKIADASITNAKIGDAAITDAKIATATITDASIANATITGAKIASATITAANIQSATITAAQIASATITGANIANATIGGANIASATITGANIASATIGAANIQSATITGANIASATITDANIANLNAAKINAGTIAAARIAAGTITSTMIATDTIVAGNIAAGAITVDELAANSVNASKIVAGSITADRLQTGTITAASGVIGDLAITTAKIANGAIESAKISNTIQSDNYSASAGWQINRAGTAFFNQVSVRGEINTGNFTGYVWPASGGGTHLSSNGLLLGNANTSRYLQWDTASGTLVIGGGGSNKLVLDAAGNLSINGTLTAAAINAVNTVNIAGNAVTIPAGNSGALPLDVPLPGLTAGQPVMLIGTVNRVLTGPDPSDPPPPAFDGYSEIQRVTGGLVAVVNGFAAGSSYTVAGGTMLATAGHTMVIKYDVPFGGDIVFRLASNYGTSGTLIAMQLKR